jgi:hypothetical protein
MVYAVGWGSGHVEKCPGVPRDFDPVRVAAAIDEFLSSAASLPRGAGLSIGERADRVTTLTARARPVVRKESARAGGRERCRDSAYLQRTGTVACDAPLLLIGFVIQR